MSARLDATCIFTGLSLMFNGELCHYLKSHVTFFRHGLSWVASVFFLKLYVYSIFDGYFTRIRSRSRIMGTYVNPIGTGHTTMTRTTKATVRRGRRQARPLTRITTATKTTRTTTVINVMVTMRSRITCRVREGKDADDEEEVDWSDDVDASVNGKIMMVVMVVVVDGSGAPCHAACSLPPSQPWRRFLTLTRQHEAKSVDKPGVIRVPATVRQAGLSIRASWRHPSLHGPPNQED